MSVPELVWTEFSTPPSTESESHDAFFPPPPLAPATQKLRKLTHPPPSFHTFSSALYADQSFSDEQHSAEYNLSLEAGRRSANQDYDRTFRSQSDSGHSYAYPRSLASTSSRPLTFLSMADSQTPLLRSLSALGTRTHTQAPAPRKLTKRRPSVYNEFKPLPVPQPKSLPMLPPTTPSKSIEQLSSVPKRRSSISFAFTVALKRRLSMPVDKKQHEQETKVTVLSKTRHKAHNVRDSSAPLPLMPSSSAKHKGKGAEKGLPSPPPPTPPAKDSTYLSFSRISFPSPAPSASFTPSKLRKTRKDKEQKKKFSISGDEEVPPLPAPPFPLIRAHYPSDPLQTSSPTQLVYDLNLDVEQKELPATPRLRPPLVRRLQDYGTPSSGHPGSRQASSYVEASTQRRWTLAMAMTSDETDEMFVQEVERIRRDSLRVFDEHDVPKKSVEGVGGFKGWEFGYLDPDVGSDSEDEDEAFDEKTFTGVCNSPERSMPDLGRSMSVAASYRTSEGALPARSASVMDMGYPRVKLPNNTSSPDPTKAWSQALHALLITRDLLRTERNYLKQLKLLLSSSPCAMTPAAQAIAETSFLWGMPGQTASTGVASTASLLSLATVVTQKPVALPWPNTPPPALMHMYLLSLIALSLSLLNEWEKDPTVAGAARVLVQKEEEIERIFVGWCGIIGGWFTHKEEKDTPRKPNPSSEEGGMEKRRRRLSKSRFMTTTPSSTHLNSSMVSAAGSTASMLSAPPTAFPSSCSTPNTLSSRRSASTSSSMSRWRKSLPIVPGLDLNLTTQQIHAESIVPFISEPPKSAGPRIGGFDKQWSSPPALTSMEMGKIRRASTFLSLNTPGYNVSELDREKHDSRGRERERDVRDAEKAEVPRSRSYGMLPRFAMSEQKPSPTNADSNDRKLRGLVDSRGRKIHSVRELGILPVQRVTRYALLFRDLLKHTPETSPSRPLLEQASAAAVRIATKCDRAQGNAELFFNIPFSG